VSKSPSRSRLAALSYMQGGITLADAGAPFRVSPKTVSWAVTRIRKEQRDVTPEDEVTL